MSEKKKYSSGAIGLARVLPNPPAKQPISETKSKPTSDSSKKKKK
jgi:hypothetical protein